MSEHGHHGPPPGAPPRRPTDLEVERWRLGELPEDEARFVEMALRVLDDPRREPTDAEDAALFERVPPGAFAEEVLRRAERLDRADASVAAQREAKASQMQWMWAPVAVAAVLLLAFLIWSRPGSTPEDPSLGGSEPAQVAVREPIDREVTRIKGQKPSLVIRRKEGPKLRELEDGTKVEAGDVLQISYVAAGRGHGVIVSIDGSGVVTMHLPSEPSHDTRLSKRKETPIGHSYELDAAPGFERFIFVAGDEPLDPEMVERAAAKLAGTGARARTAPLDLSGLGEDLVQTSVLLTKAK